MRLRYFSEVRSQASCILTHIHVLCRGTSECLALLSHLEYRESAAGHN